MLDFCEKVFCVMIMFVVVRMVIMVVVRVLIWVVMLIVSVNKNRLMICSFMVIYGICLGGFVDMCELMVQVLLNMKGLKIV